MHFKSARKRDSGYHETLLVTHHSSYRPSVTLCRKDRVGIWPWTRKLGGSPVVWGECATLPAKRGSRRTVSQCSAWKGRAMVLISHEWLLQPMISSVSVNSPVCSHMLPPTPLFLPVSLSHNWPVSLYYRHWIYRGQGLGLIFLVCPELRCPQTNECVHGLGEPRDRAGIDFNSCLLLFTLVWWP